MDDDNSLMKKNALILGIAIIAIGIGIAIVALVARLNPAPDHLGGVDAQRNQETFGKQLVGIGAELRFDHRAGQIVVVSPLAGSPALKAGLRAGDAIVTIDGMEIREFPKGKELETAVELIRGQSGEPVHLGIRRPGKEAIDSVRITRGPIQLESVRGERRRPDQEWEFMLSDQDKIGYVGIREFDQGTLKECRNALTDLKRRGMKGLVLDLRSNPGGRLLEAVGVADLFNEDGTIVTARQHQGQVKTWTATKASTLSGFPIAVLANRTTSSAGEVLAACLQDHGRAVVIGERTYGQGEVRSAIPFEGGNTGVKMPTTSLFRPNGRALHRSLDASATDDWGVRPDQQIECTDDEVKRHLENRNQRDVVKAEVQLDEEFRDRALEAALSHLREKL